MRRDLKKSGFLILLILFMSILEVVVFAVERGWGDYFYGFTCIVFTLIAIWKSRQSKGRFISMISGLLMALILLTANTFWMYYVRSSLLNLSDDYGSSDMIGFIVFLMIVPLTLLAAVLSFVLFVNEVDE